MWNTSSPLSEVKAVSVKIVTDSVADLPQDVAERLSVGVVPLYVRFGTDVYRDRIDLTIEQFYVKLREEKCFPVTSVPSPADFARMYDKVAGTAEAIVAVTVSAKLSGTYNAAVQGVKLMIKRCPVEVIDSQSATMAEGFVVMRAAEAAQSGASLDEIGVVVGAAIPRAHLLATFDTLEYLKRGGRIGAAQALLGSALKINPLIGLRDGLVYAAGRTRSRRKAVDLLVDFVRGFTSIEELAVGHTACRDESEQLIERLGELHPMERIHRTKLTPVIGAHTGPGLLLVSVLGDRQ